MNKACLLILSCLLCVGCSADTKVYEFNPDFSAYPEEREIAKKYVPYGIAVTLPGRQPVDAIAIDTYDLNDDGTKEFFIFTMRDDTCIEHMCESYILEKSESKWQVIFHGLTYSGGVFVLSTKTKGYPDLRVELTGDKEILRPSTEWYQWNGSEYQSVRHIFLDSGE